LGKYDKAHKRLHVHHHQLLQEYYA
jgi:hypothetical protein